MVADQFNRESVSRSLFQACKIVLLHWKSTSPPSLTEWVEHMGITPRFEWVIYQHRGYSAKFDGVWGGWLDIPGLTPIDLVLTYC